MSKFPLPHSLRRLFINRQVLIGFTLTTFILLLAIAGPWFSPYLPQDLTGVRYGHPNAGAILGYDYLGHDVLSRVLYGGRSIVWMALASSLIALVIGATLGLVAGFFRRKIDQFIIWWADIFLAFPNLILVLLIVSMLGRDKWLIVITVAIAFIPGVVRLTRSVSLGIAQQEYIEATEMMAYPYHQILLKEILPNITTPLLIHLGTMLSWAVAILSGLSFLGYGVAPPEADWGLMVNENRGGLQIQPYAVLVPIILIAFFALGTNLLAEGLGRNKARIAERK
jgi:peptide/nickel transport system permease protein